MGMTDRCGGLLAILGLLAGCCLEVGGVGVTSSSSGKIIDATTGSSSTGGSSTGSSTGGSSHGGSSTGAKPVQQDAGTCLIDGTLIEAGDWLSQRFGSCTICDPDLNPTKWTAQPQGTPCVALVDIYIHYPPDSGLVPITATCQTDVHPPLSVCTGLAGGDPCPDEDEVCVGSSCNGSQCEVTENLGAFSWCDSQGIFLNDCVAGPCCPDAGTPRGSGGETEGWCCGLPDGGVPPCGTAGNICAYDSQCCEGLACQPRGIYGTCE